MAAANPPARAGGEWPRAGGDADRVTCTRAARRPSPPVPPPKQILPPLQQHHQQVPPLRHPVRQPRNNQLPEDLVQRMHERPPRDRPRLAHRRPIRLDVPALQRHLPAERNLQETKAGRPVDAGEGRRPPPGEIDGESEFLLPHLQPRRDVSPRHPVRELQPEAEAVSVDGVHCLRGGASRDPVGGGGRGYVRVDVSALQRQMPAEGHVQTCRAGSTSCRASHSHAGWAAARNLPAEQVVPSVRQRLQPRPHPLRKPPDARMPEDGVQSLLE